MNIRFFVIALLIFLSGSDIKHTSVPEIKHVYILGNDSRCYEEVNGKHVPVMFAGGTPKRLDTLSLSPENYLEVCEFYNIADPELVYAQSCLESGHFTSRKFKTKNNHLGIKKGKGYASYDNWAMCLKDYSDRVAYKKHKNENHYTFLIRIGYAEDEEYVNKVKSVVQYNRKQGKTNWNSSGK